ncbi:hypothetical protein HY008_03720 [Candidatus Woesebacteria bacterium]|nr:hypothetical protein [Candidatus Woesebacteria bacterium]
MKNYSRFLPVVIFFITVFLLGWLVFTPQGKIYLARIIIRRGNNTNSTILQTLATPTLELTQTGTVANLVDCLRERSFIMYGSSGCSACATQRSYFGESFSKLPYIDCSLNQKLCQAKNIRSYPTWENREGRQFKGAIPLSTLAQLSNCPAPQ